MPGKLKRIILFWGIIFAFFLKAGFVFALEARYPSLLGFSVNDLSTLPEYARYFFNAGMALAAFIAAAATAYGGIYYILSFASGKFTNEGKEWIKSGLLGLLIVFGAYLISYTINPNLVIFRLDKLPAIVLQNPLGNPGLTTNAAITTYKEIPIGALTETLLTRTMDCYGFDQSGNPIDGEKISKEFTRPTYLNHDRTDCLTQIVAGAQKKAEVVAALSDEIMRLMDTCSCRVKDKDGKDTDVSKCAPLCGGGAGCKAPTSCPGGTCGGSCVGAACKELTPPQDCCPTTDPKTGKPLKIKVKDQIEHGPVLATFDVTEIDENSAQQNWGPGTSASCQPGSLNDDGAIVYDPIDIIAGPGIDQTLLRQAINKWNALTPWPVFGSIVQPGTVDAKNAKGIIEAGGPDLLTDVCGGSTGATGKTAGGCTVNKVAEAYYNSGHPANAVVGFHTVINNQQGQQPNQYWQYIYIHELGHVLGLSHPRLLIDGKPTGDYVECKKSVMSYIWKVVSQPGAADQQAIKGLYNADVLSYLPKNNNSLFAKIALAAKRKKPDFIGYKGLDEFRSQYSNNYRDIKKFVEKTVKADGKSYTIIDSKKWHKLRLIDQLTYLKGKMNEIKDTIPKDISVLDQARSALGNCYARGKYAAVPYVDLLKTYESAKRENRIILTDSKTFFDPQTNEPVDSSKYCRGFNYANSNCFKKCSDACPDSSPQAMNLYQNCSSSKDQEACIENAYKSRPCLYGENALRTFSGCIDSCQNDCVDNCAKKYPHGSFEYNFCKSQCADDQGDPKSSQGDSQCILNNAESCLFGAEGFADCADQVIDSGNAKFCINNAYLCKSGSNEYAGYPDCTEPSPTECLAIKDRETCEKFFSCKWDNGICQQNYSGSFLYKNMDYEKCPYPHNPSEEGTSCYDTNNPDATCQEVCPETTKCLSSSDCPGCPCDQITKPFKIPIPNKSILPETKTKPDRLWCGKAKKPFVPGGNIGKEGYSILSQKITTYQMAGPQCNEYSYNDDPLTFYCESNWWDNPNKEANNPVPIGAERICSESRDIPIGQTVDDAKNWANNLVSTIDGSSAGTSYIKNGNNIDKGIQKIIDQMKKIGKAKDTNPIKNYCKCNAKSEKSEAICVTNCQYDECPTEEGSMVCSCKFVPCEGNPCMQVIDYLSKLWNIYRDFKLDFTDFYTTVITEPRSDIIKELTYSRKTTNDCSLINSVHGQDARLLSCTTLEDEQIPPVSTTRLLKDDLAALIHISPDQLKNLGTDKNSLLGYCYGQKLGGLFNKPLTDNWFCCQKYSKNPAQNEK